jgi:hypothetical protein
MSANSLETKNIESLLNYSFYVNSYQRGYRWGAEDVTNLLKDIADFANNKIEGEFYCLQPVVVMEKEEDCYELIDGQQRITTIYLLLFFLKHKQIISADKAIYTIDYNTRTSSTGFLHKLYEIINHTSWAELIKSNVTNDKIDNYHFFQALIVIANYFEGRREEEMQHFRDSLLNDTKVIWYRVHVKNKNGTEAQEIFERINIGKIPLTNAELIKALFLNSKVKKEKCLEIAEKWDRMEYALRNDRLWYFINPGKNEAPTRIEFIFDSVAKKYDNIHNKEEKLHTFLHFQKSINGTEIDKLWEKVEACFYVLQEWFESPELYHYIGFLVTRKIIDVNALLKKYTTGNTSGKSKSEFISEVKSLIREHLKDHKIEELSYENKADEKIIRNILLLFNLQTTLNTTPENFFPFERYNIIPWSLEHIHAQHSDGLKEEDAIKNWAKETKVILDKFTSNPEKSEEANHLINDLQKLAQQPKSSLFKEISEKVFSFFSDGVMNGFHSLENLALLDRDTNSSLNNSIFPLKREKIFKAELDEKIFIPICTKNVFLKYYSKDVSQMYFWSQTDKDDYLEHIRETLIYFIPKK